MNNHPQKRLGKVYYWDGKGKKPEFTDGTEVVLRSRGNQKKVEQQQATAARVAAGTAGKKPTVLGAALDAALGQQEDTKPEYVGVARKTPKPKNTKFTLEQAVRIKDIIIRIYRRGGNNTEMETAIRNEVKPLANQGEFQFCSRTSFTNQKAKMKKSGRITEAMKIERKKLRGENPTLKATGKKPGRETDPKILETAKYAVRNAAPKAYPGRKSQKRFTSILTKRLRLEPSNNAYTMPKRKGEL